MISATISILGFVAMLGIAESVGNGMMPIRRGMDLMFLAFAVFAVFLLVTVRSFRMEGHHG